MKNFFCYFLGFGLLLGHQAVLGQNQIIPPSPEAAAFNKFLNYPVNYNTGVPEISIPLYEINVGGMKLPITLSYHASGIKVNEQSTWVGLGWNLSLEPQISRMMNGGDDLAGYYLSNSKVGAYDSGYMGSTDLDYLDKLTKGLFDEQPDRFNYKLASSSGSFMFQKYANNQNEIVTIPYSPIKVNRNNSNNTFDIKDLDGTSYLFNVGETSSSNLYNIYTSGWKCSQMISPSKKDTISFQYNTLRNTNYYGYFEKLEIGDAMGSDDRTYINNYCYCPPSYSGAIYEAGHLGMGAGSGRFEVYDQTDFYIGWVGRVFKYVGGMGLYNPEIRGNAKSANVNEINFRGGKVKFFSSVPIPDGGGKLDSIKVYNSNMVLIKTIKLFMSYFKTPDLNTYPAPDFRLRLDSVVFSDQNIKHSSYKFSYHYPQTIYPWGKFSDAWGYYKDYGQYPHSSGTSIPYYPNMSIMDTYGTIYSRWLHTYNIGGYLKDSYLETTKNFVLEKVIYPTKGRTEYTYNLNKYKVSDSLINAGGLRVESIKTYADETSNQSVSERIYKYGENEFGDGELRVKPSSSSYMYEQFISKSQGSERRRTFVGTSMEDLYFSNGSPINYTTVTEYQKDMGVFTGKTVYKYSPYTFINNVPSLTNSTHWPGTDITIKKIDIEGGQLLSTTNYAYDNSSFSWISQVNNQYQKFEKPDKIHIGRIFRNKIYEPDVSWVYKNVSDYTYLAYPQEVATMLLSSRTEKSRSVSDTNNINTITKNYFYDNPLHLQVSRVEKTEGDGSITTNSISYPQDYATGTPFIENMKANHVIAYPIEKVSYQDVGGAKKILSGEVFSYKQEGNGVSDKTYVLESGQAIDLASFKFSNRSTGILPIAGSAASYSLDSHYKEKLSYDTYDERYNPLKLTLNKKQLVSYLWGYNKKYPVAEVTNASDNEIYYEGFEEPTLTPWGTSIFSTGSYGGSINIDPSHKHSGANSGRIDNTGSGEKTSHSNKWLSISLTAPKRFHYSGWVYSDGPGTKLHLFMKKTGETGYLSYIDNVASTQKEKWVYLERDFLVPADVTALSLRIDAFGSGSAWFDDLRIYPSDAQMTTYTYKPLVGMTSQTDAKGLTTYYEYDRFQRLKNIKDFEGNIVKSFDYHYKGTTP